MPYSTYCAGEMGRAEIFPKGPFEAGALAEITLVYTAGTFGIDDTGMLKVTWRTTSDMAKPQLTDPAGLNYTSVEASNGAVLECRIDRVNIRPWTNALVIRVGRGFLRAGETITVRFGDRRKGSPGLRLQTNAEATFELKIVVDAFATYQFAELERSPEFALVAGPVASVKAVIPSRIVEDEPFRLAIVAEDRWGNPTGEAEGELRLSASAPVTGLPDTIRLARGDGPVVIEGLRAQTAGPLLVAAVFNDGLLRCSSNPADVVAAPPPRRLYWGDLHGQSEETVGTNSIDDYLRYARDRAFVDIVGHQGNDFQMTDAFWARLNRLTAAYNEPGRFLAIPGYEWSGNTGMGGDRNVFYRHEGRPIRRSSEILIEGTTSENATQHRAGDLFKALAGEDAVVIAHVGGRYADITVAHDGRLERAVEVHSTWGTFVWLLHDAFAKGYRVGVVAHSDDHKGRPGATRPGASTFGAIGGLTCYAMSELTRDALFDALRARRHYGTSGNRMLLELSGTFDRRVDVFEEDPALGPAVSRPATAVEMGAIVRARGAPMRLKVKAVGTAPIDRVDVFHGTELVRSVRGYGAGDLGRRVRVLWEGAEYRGRGRETLWKGTMRLEGAKARAFSAVNFLNPERLPRVTEAGVAVAWESVTTGNMAAIDIEVDGELAGMLSVETNLISGRVDLARLGMDEVVLEAGGLGRRVRIWRLPDVGLKRTLTVDHEAVHTGGGDLPVWVRVTQEDCNQAWSSPIYLIGPD